MDRFVKVYQSIRSSSVWDESSDTRICWVTALLLAEEAEQEGFFRGTIQGFARAANVPAKKAAAALEFLCSADEANRDQANDGRRLVAEPGGWRVLNFKPFRDAKTEDERREYKADWQRQRREEARKQGGDKVKTGCGQAEDSLKTPCGQGEDKVKTDGGHNEDCILDSESDSERTLNVAPPDAGSPPADAAAPSDSSEEESDESGQDPPGEDPGFTPDHRQFVVAFRESYIRLVNPKYRFPRAISPKELRAARAFYRDPDWPESRIQRLLEAIILHQADPPEGWGFVVRSVASLRKKCQDIAEKLLKEERDGATRD